MAMVVQKTAIAFLLITKLKFQARRATLPVGTYYLQITGNAGATAGYGGTLSTVGVRGPIVGAGLPGLVMACGGLLALARRRREVAA
jgi:hypothetical protein